MHAAEDQSGSCRDMKKKVWIVAPGIAYVAMHNEKAPQRLMDEWARTETSETSTLES